MRWLALILALAGCAIPPPSQIDAPGKLSGDVLDHWAVSVETGWVVPAVLEWRRPRRDQFGVVVTYKGAF